MTLMSHFADAENPQGIIEPMRRIEQAAEGLDCRRSLANSAATLWHPEAHFDWVRPGLCCMAPRLPANGRISPIWPSPVMTLSSEIIAVQNLKAERRWATAAVSGIRRTAHWDCGLRLRRRLSARGAGRYAGAG